MPSGADRCNIMGSFNLENYILHFSATVGLFCIYFFFSDCSVLFLKFLLFGCRASCICHSFINIFSPFFFSLIFPPSIFWEIPSSSYFRLSIDFSFLFTFFLTLKGFICSLKFSFLFLSFCQHPVLVWNMQCVCMIGFCCQFLLAAEFLFL